MGTEWTIVSWGYSLSGWRRRCGTRWGWPAERNQTGSVDENHWRSPMFALFHWRDIFKRTRVQRKLALKSFITADVEVRHFHQSHIYCPHQRNLRLNLLLLSYANANMYIFCLHVRAESLAVASEWEVSIGPRRAPVSSHSSINWRQNSLGWSGDLWPHTSVGQ